MTRLSNVAGLYIQGIQRSVRYSLFAISLVFLQLDLAFELGSILPILLALPLIVGATAAMVAPYSNTIYRINIDYEIKENLYFYVL